jgi:hypothetical protein
MVRNRAITVAILLIGSASFSQPTVAPYSSLADTEELKNGVVKITVSRPDNVKDTGSGIVVGVVGHLVYCVTAFHVLNGDESQRQSNLEAIDIRVQFHRVRTLQFKGRVENFDEQNDLALIVVDDPEITLVGPSIEFSLGDLSDIKQLDAVVTIGHPRSIAWAVASGEIRGVYWPHFHFSAEAIEQGNSGGPLIDKRRLVLLGMVTSINAGRPPSGKALSVEYIVRKLDAWGVPRQLQQGKMAKSMIVVPSGEFVMGLDDAATDAYPRRKVYLDEFQIDKHEVTVEEFRRFVSEAGYEFQIPSTRDCNYGKNGKEKYPMNCVSWVDANAYAKWAGKSLPTEAEWEKAARGETGPIYPWGNDSFKAGDAVIDMDETAPVGSHPKDRSAYGVMDMLGNVSEWIDDWYD